MASLRITVSAIYQKNYGLVIERDRDRSWGRGLQTFDLPLSNDFIEQQAPHPGPVRLTPGARIAGQPRTDVTDRTADLPHDSRSRADDVCLQEFEL